MTSVIQYIFAKLMLISNSWISFGNITANSSGSSYVALQGVGHHTGGQ